MPASSANRRPAAGSSPSHLAASDAERGGRGRRPTVSPSLDRSSATTRSARSADFRECLPAGDVVAPDGPARPFLPDVERLQPFVLAVVPLPELVPHHCDVTEPGKPAGLHRAEERARERRARAAARRSTTPMASSVTPPCSVSGTSVRPVCLPRAAPLGLSVTDEDDFGRPVGHASSARQREERHGVSHTAKCQRTVAPLPLP